MRVNKTKGVNINNEIIDESLFEKSNLYFIDNFVEKLFKDFGYNATSVYDEDKNLIIISSNNLNNSFLYGSVLDTVYNYKTGEHFAISREQHNGINPLYNHKIEITKKGDKFCASIDGVLHLIKDDIKVLSKNLISYKQRGIYYIYNIEEGKEYPISYLKDVKDNSFTIHAHGLGDKPPKMINNMSDDNINYLFDNYNIIYNGEKRYEAFYMEIKYGIDIDGKIKWYSSLEERDLIYNRVVETVYSIIDSKKEDIMYK